MASSSTWYALRNPVFRRIWVASVLSGTFISAQDVTVTWLMHDLGASFSLSLIATASSTPLLLLALPAGIIADRESRRMVLLGAVAWQGLCSALLALAVWSQAIGINSLLACMFALGIGLAFAAPVWSAIVPGIVSKAELPSAVTLGGVQVNIAGIVGPALGGFLLPLVGAPVLISLNAVMFLAVGFLILRWKPRQASASKPSETFVESFTGSLRYAGASKNIKTVLFRNFLFSFVVSVLPALLPVIILRELKCSAAQLGFAFTCVALGSLTGAVFLLPPLRKHTSPNAITSIAMGLLVLVLVPMAFFRTFPSILASSFVAGIAWALTGAELWLAGQRATPGWVRGRVNAFLMMAGQGGIALGSVLLAMGARNAGLELTLCIAAAFALIGVGLGFRFSINFAATETPGSSAPEASTPDPKPSEMP